MIYVAEVGGRAVAGVDAVGLDEARDFLLPAVEEMAREMFERDWNTASTRARQFVARRASPEKTSMWERSIANKTSSYSRVVWFFSVPHIDRQ